MAQYSSWEYDQFKRYTPVVYWLKFTSLIFIQKRGGLKDTRVNFCLTLLVEAAFILSNHLHRLGLTVAFIWTRGWETRIRFIL